MALPWLVLLTLLALAATPPAQAQDAVPPGHVDLQLTFEQSRGLYGDATSTRIRNTAFVARYRGETWVGEIQVPLLEVRSADATGGLPGSVVAGRSVERGLGDIWLKFGVEVREFTTDSAGVDLTLKIKTRSGDINRGLGTGGTDVALQLDVTRMLGPVVGWGQVGYRRTGDVPGYTPYRDPWYGEIGAYHQTTPALEFGAFVDVREPIGRLGSLREATLYTAWRAGSHRIQFYVARGFATASADWAAGVTLRTRF